MYTPSPTVQQMIVGVFREFWFSPPPISSETDSLLRRVTSITTVVRCHSTHHYIFHVVCTCRYCVLLCYLCLQVGMWSEHEWFEQLVKPVSFFVSSFPAIKLATCIFKLLFPSIVTVCLSTTITGILLAHTRC